MRQTPNFSYVTELFILVYLITSDTEGKKNLFSLHNTKES